MATIEIDGKKFEVDSGKMIIEVADDAGIHIPRFCYHKKLSVAANCRMCLVEVENGSKTVPACATPIADGMKVYTKSEQTLISQKAVMDFLLINHPLDCPICDQGGECELQDVSMGFGHDSSHYAESKRAVADDNLGTLISTEMTRCIHCTRCVRFGTEVAGVRELGLTGRGETSQIGTFVEHSMTSEVSANIIDLCPVGALTSKPYRFTARAWEMTQHDSIAPHDCLGSNVYIHVLQGKVKRVVPKENETINETWISDRDRFSYLGLHSPERAREPMIKRNGQWEVVDWETALKFAVDGLKKVIAQHGGEQVAGFVSSSATLEELYLFQKLMRANNINNIDYRLQQTDFSDQDYEPLAPSGTLDFANLDKQKNILIVGSNLHREVPLAGVRVRKACSMGAHVFAVNPVSYQYPFDVEDELIVTPNEMPQALASILVALEKSGHKLPEAIKNLIDGIVTDKSSDNMAKQLSSDGAVIVTGALVENHPYASTMRTLIATIIELTGAKLIRLTSGANVHGASIAGCLPHRGAAGKAMETAGFDVQQAIANKLKAYILMGVETGSDFANPYLARRAMLGAEFVVMLNAYQNDAMRDYANVILPIAPYTETSGTYINLDGVWQTVKGATMPLGEARPGWKVLRVLGNLFDVAGFDFVSTQEVFEEIKTISATQSFERPHKSYVPENFPDKLKGLQRVGEWPLYRVDSIVRRAQALQYCAAADVVKLRVHPDTVEACQLNTKATVSQNDIEITLPVETDERVARGAVWVVNAMPETEDLGSAFAEITIKDK